MSTQQPQYDSLVEDFAQKCGLAPSDVHQIVATGNTAGIDRKRADKLVLLIEKQFGDFDNFPSSPQSQMS